MARYFISCHVTILIIAMSVSKRKGTIVLDLRTFLTKSIICPIDSFGFLFSFLFLSYFFFFLFRQCLLSPLNAFDVWNKVCSLLNQFYMLSFSLGNIVRKKKKKERKQTIYYYRRKDALTVKCISHVLITFPIIFWSYLRLLHSKKIFL